MDVARYRRAEDALWAAVAARPTERWLALERGGTMIRVLELGDGAPVVFVHGASNAATSWAPLAARLTGLRCLLVDRPGAGLSPPLDERLTDMVRFDAFAEDLLVDVLDATGITDAHVVATSFGGYFMLRGAAAHPDRFRRLVELGWPFGAPVESTPLMMRLAMQPVIGRSMTRIRPNERMVRALLRQIGLRHALESGAFGDVELAWFLSLLRDTATLRNEIDAAPRLATLRGFDDATLLPSSVLRRVTAPTLFMWGADDPMGGAAIARRFVGELPAAELELMVDTGHAPWIDDPDRVAARIGAFLRG